MKAILVSMIILASTSVLASETTKLYCTLTKNFQFEDAQILFVKNGGTRERMEFKDGTRFVVAQDGTFTYVLIAGKATSRVETTATEVVLESDIGQDHYSVSCEYALSNPTP